MPGLKLPPLVHYIITVKLNGCLWNSAQWLWTQYHRMMIITHCHALCGGCTFAYFTQVWQSAEWHYRSKQGNLCNLISANKQPLWNQCDSRTVTGTSFLPLFFACAFLFFLIFAHTLHIFVLTTASWYSNVFCHRLSEINAHLKLSNTSVQIDHASYHSSLSFSLSPHCVTHFYQFMYRWPKGHLAPGPYDEPI